MGPTAGGEGPRAEGGRGEESFGRSNTPDTRVGGFYVESFNGAKRVPKCTIALRRRIFGFEPKLGTNLRKECE